MGLVQAFSKGGSIADVADELEGDAMPLVHPIEERCMYMYTCIYVYIHVCIYIHIYTYI